MFNLHDPEVLRTWLLSLIIFLPVIGSLVLCVLPVRCDQCLKRFSLLITVLVFLLTVWLILPGGVDLGHFTVGEADMQTVVKHEWIPSFHIEYYLGLDGISLPLVILTSFLSMLAMWASWGINKSVRAYCALFLLLETGMLGVFMALDFFLFYVFWEVMLLPMYFLIGVWGGPRREYAAIKFFLFTLAGSVLMLVAILILYYNSNPHTFSITELAAIGQQADSPFSNTLLWGKSASWWAFVLLFVGFAVKLPAVPIHTWLPDAHVEAPTPISMILAGVLLKMGGYGIIRICYPICPDAGFELAWWVCGLGTVSMVYGALAALAQKDFKRLVAYSSVSHMGYVLLGIGVWSATAGNQFNTDYWTMAMSGAMFQMIAHGISSAGMFFLVGVVYDRVHHRNLDQFGGLFPRMPVYSGISMIIFFAALGLPGLCGFWGELFVVLGAWSYSKVLAIITASVVILTAGYILWTIQRVYLGAEYKGPHAEALKPMSRREKYIAVPLVALAILFGVYPKVLFDYITPSVEKTVVEMKDWAERSERLDTDSQKVEQEAEQQDVGWDKRSEAPPQKNTAERNGGARFARPTLLSIAERPSVDSQEVVQP